MTIPNGSLTHSRVYLTIDCALSGNVKYMRTKNSPAEDWLVRIIAAFNYAIGAISRCTDNIAWEMASLAAPCVECCEDLGGSKSAGYYYPRQDTYWKFDQALDKEQNTNLSGAPYSKYLLAFGFELEGIRNQYAHTSDEKVIVAGSFRLALIAIRCLLAIDAVRDITVREHV